MGAYKRESVTGFQTRIGLNKNFSNTKCKKNEARTIGTNIDNEIKKYYKLKSKEAKLHYYKKCLKLTKKVIDKIKNEFGQYIMYPQKKFETKFNNGEYKLDGITDLYGEKIRIDQTGKIIKEMISIELKYTSIKKKDGIDI